jgi:hypothetical protein
MTRQEAGRIGGRVSYERRTGIHAATAEQREEWRQRALEALRAKTPEELFETRSAGGKAAQARPGGSGCTRKGG